MGNKKHLLALGLFLVLLVAAFLGFTFMNRRAPRIDELSTLLSEPGERVEISGRRFGESRSLSKIYFDDRPLNLSYVEEWSENSLYIVVPPFTGSVLVTVETDHGRSNSLVLYNRNDFPRFSLEPFLPELPYIEFINPSEGGSGTLVSIRGSNFGDNRRNSRIIVNGRMDNHLAFFDIPDEKDFISLRKESYREWSMNRISFYIPEGVESGFLYIITDKGFSNPIYFDVTQKGAEMTLSRPIQYQMEQKVSLDQLGAWPGNTLFLWLPLPADSSRQKNISLIGESREPYFFSGPLTLYRYDELVSGQELVLNRQFVVTLYDYRLEADRDSIPRNYDKDQYIYGLYTEETEEYPISNRTLRNRSSYGTGGKTHPYDKARSLYDFLIDRISWQEEAMPGNPLDVIEQRKGNTDDYVRAFVSLLRAAGIPAREVKGLLLDKDMGESRLHSWVEVYFERVGWFPVDPALADGATEGEKSDRELYWGKLTNRHMAFSRGLLACPRLDDSGVVRQKLGSYSGQEIHEEKLGNISFYRSIWDLPHTVMSRPLDGE